jgi:hypothetical protein
VVQVLTDHQLEKAMTEALQALDINRFEQLAAEADQWQEHRRSLLQHPEALLSSALWYAEQGMPVFPCRPRSKTPITTHGFYDASTDHDQIRRWWTTTPAANIGTPTGKVFDCIDVDGPTGYQSLGKLRECDLLPPHIGRSWTPGDPPERPPGMHYLITSTGDGNATAMAPGLDYRGIGGYIILPPSAGPNGDRYEWLTPPQVSA